MFGEFRDNETYEKLKEEIKKMSHKDLITYKNIYASINRLASFCGISVFVCMLIFFNVFVLVMGPILIYWLGGVGVICDKLYKLFKLQLQEVPEDR